MGKKSNKTPPNERTEDAPQRIVIEQGAESICKQWLPGQVWGMKIAGVGRDAETGIPKRNEDNYPDTGEYEQDERAPKQFPELYRWSRENEIQKTLK